MLDLDAAAQPLALEHLHATQPGFEVRAVQPDLQPMADQPGRHAVVGGLDTDQAELADPRVDLFEVHRPSSRQGPKAGTLDFPGPSTTRVQSPHGICDELTVALEVRELTCAAQ
jgi:hypothetical protein